MENELLFEKQLLEKRIKQMTRIYHQIDFFLKVNAPLYKAKASIQAIKGIKLEFISFNIELQREEALLEKINNKLLTSCSHEIIINDNYSYCAICGNRLKNIDNACLEIKISQNNRRTNEKISKIVRDYITNKSKQELENNLEELQYQENIEVRRLKL